MEIFYFGNPKYQSFPRMKSLIPSRKTANGSTTARWVFLFNRITTQQLPGQSPQAFRYDAAGRPLATQTSEGQDIRTMSYGYGDKVLTSKTADSTAEFYYNAEGQLIGKKTGGKVSTYTWDGNVLAADQAQAYTNEAHITGGVPILSAGTEVVTSDYLGNTLASGNQQFTSTAYGEGLEAGRFTGKPFVKELNSYVFQHRNYSPETNRWTVADPSGFPDGKNNTVYVNGKPLTTLDPQGTWEVLGLDLPVVGPTLQNGQAPTTTIRIDYTYTKTQKPTYTIGSARVINFAQYWSLPECNIKNGTLTDVTGDPKREYWREAVATASAIYKDDQIAPERYTKITLINSPSWEK